MEEAGLEKQTIKFPVLVRNNIVDWIGKAYITHPQIQLNGKGIKWYEDKAPDKAKDI